jgi:hypothetical protein
MDISIFGFKLNLEILILIGVVYLILVGRTICGCANFYRKIEGYDNAEMTEGGSQQSYTATSSGGGGGGGGGRDESNTELFTKEFLSPAEVPASSSVNSTSSGSKKSASKEPFVGANTNYGESAAYPLNQTTYLNTSQWGGQNLTVIPGKSIPKAAQAIIDRPNQSLPLPEGQLSLFDNMPFSPECCPNTYSSSMGCACMNSTTYNYLITRAGNNVPYSEY